MIALVASLKIEPQCPRPCRDQRVVLGQVAQQPYGQARQIVFTGDLVPVKDRPQVTRSNLHEYCADGFFRPPCRTSPASAGASTRLMLGNRRQGAGQFRKLEAIGPVRREPEKRGRVPPTDGERRPHLGRWPARGSRTSYRLGAKHCPSPWSFAHRGPMIYQVNP